jgi:hypothetical protein
MRQGVQSQRASQIWPIATHRSSIDRPFNLPKLFFDDDHAGKAVGMDLSIGKRPYATFGANSTGDQGPMRAA